MAQNDTTSESAPSAAAASSAAPVSDEEIDGLVSLLHAVARDHNKYHLGLPYINGRDQLRTAVRVWLAGLQQPATGNTMTSVSLDGGPFDGCTCDVHRTAPPAEISLPLDSDSEWRGMVGLSADGPAYAVYGYDERDAVYRMRTVTPYEHGHVLGPPPLPITFN